MNKARETRPYRQGARARQTRETGERILEATIRTFVADGYAALTLARVAETAGVTTQTVIRRFGDKDGLVAAAAEAASAEIAAQRGAVPVGDLDGIVDNLLDHYAAHGGTALRLLADEGASPQVAALADAGRAFHREWCANAFAPQLAPLTGADRRRRLAQLTAVCDVYVWKLLHLDGGLPRRELRTALLELLRPITTDPTD